MSEISAFGVEHTSISKALKLPKLGSPARRHAASAVRRSRSKSAATRASRKSHAAAEGTWLAKNPELAKLKHRATNRPHHSQFKPADPKELSFYNANNKLRSYDVITKRDALEHHRKKERKYDRRANAAIVGAPASMAGAWAGSTALERLGKVKRGPIGRLNARAPGYIKAAGSKPVAAIAGGLGTGASLVAAGHYGRKANKHGAIARGIETRRKKNRSK